MSINPESSHHEEGPGQNEIDFIYSSPLKAADNVLTLQTVVKTVANRNGLFADFSPKPISDKAGNGFHITISVEADNNSQNLTYVIAGIMDKAPDITAFLNPSEASYERLGKEKAPKFVSWSSENRSQFIRLPSLEWHGRRAELRSPDPTANPYIAYALMIYAGVYGIKNKLTLPPVTETNIKDDNAGKYKKLPQSLKEAKKQAAGSEFIKSIFPEKLLDSFI